MNTIKISKLLDKTTDLKDEDITIVSSNENSSLKSKRVSFIKIFDYIKTKLYGLDYVVKSVNDRKADSDGNITISHVESADKATQSDEATKSLSSDYAFKAHMLKDGKVLGVNGAITGQIDNLHFEGDRHFIPTTLNGDNDSVKTVIDNRINLKLNEKKYVQKVNNITPINGNVTITHVESAGESTHSDTSTKLSQNRTISLTGDVTGSVTTNLGSNFSINTTVANNSHTHTISNITNLSTILSAKYDKTDFRCDDGEILYPQQDGTFRKNTIMDNSLVVDSPEDLSACINSKPSYENIFNKFKVFVNSGTNKAVLKGYRSSFNTVYNTLSSESHPLSSMYYDIASINYDSGLNTIVQSRNSQFPNGFVSPNKYSDYDITIRCYSPYASNDDGDQLGLIAAYAEDENGVPVYLTFTRTAPFSNASLYNFSTSSGGYTSLNARNTCIPSFSYIDGKDKVQSYTDKVNSSGMQWICGINTSFGCADLHTQTNHVVSIIDGNVKYGKDSPNIWTTVLADGSGTLRFENDVNPNEIQYDPSKVCHLVSPTASSNIFGDFARSRQYRWDDFRSGFLIRVIRSGNKFTATTSELEQRETSSNVSQNHTNHGLKLKDYTKIEIDLDELLADERITEDVKKTLRLFTTKASYGFFNSSSPYSTYELINIDIPETTIVNMMDNTVIRKINGTWKVIDGLTPSDYVGRGRFSYNYITHKLFYSSEIDNDIYQVGQIK